jgi:hypothetical protein
MILYQARRTRAFVCGKMVAAPVAMIFSEKHHDVVDEIQTMGSMHQNVEPHAPAI